MILKGKHNEDHINPDRSFGPCIGSFRPSWHWRSFQKRLEKDTKSAQVDLNKFMHREFACEANARKQAEIWKDEHPFHKLVDLDIVTKCKRSGQKRGRPKKGEEMVTVYQILARLDINEEIFEKARHKLGRFMLASNDTEIINGCTKPALALQERLLHPLALVYVANQRDKYSI